MPAREKIRSIFTNINSPWFWINCDSSVTGEQPLVRFWSTGRFHKSKWKANKRLGGNRGHRQEVTTKVNQAPLLAKQKLRSVGIGSSLHYSFPLWVVSMHLIYSYLPWSPQLSPDPKDWNSRAFTAQHFNFLRGFFFRKAASWTAPFLKHWRKRRIIYRSPSLGMNSPAACLMLLFLVSPSIMAKKKIKQRIICKQY